MRDLQNHKIQPPAYFREEVEAVAAAGGSKLGVARHFGISIATLNRWFEENEDFAEAYRQGRDQERQKLHNVLVREAEKGNITAAMALLKSRHGYRDNETSDQANKIAITFNLPGAMNAAEYQSRGKTIDAIVRPAKENADG